MCLNVFHRHLLTRMGASEYTWCPIFDNFLYRRGLGRRVLCLRLSGLGCIRRKCGLGLGFIRGRPGLDLAVGLGFSFGLYRRGLGRRVLCLRLSGLGCIRRQLGLGLGFILGKRGRPGLDLALGLGFSFDIIYQRGLGRRTLCLRLGGHGIRRKRCLGLVDQKGRPGLRYLAFGLGHGRDTLPRCLRLRGLGCSRGLGLGFIPGQRGRHGLDLALDLGFSFGLYSRGLGRRTPCLRLGGLGCIRRKWGLGLGFIPGRSGRPGLDLALGLGFSFGLGLLGPGDWHRGVLLSHT